MGRKAQAGAHSRHALSKAGRQADRQAPTTERKCRGERSKKGKKEKKDLISKIDSQLAKLKSKNKGKAKETEGQKEVEDDDAMDLPEST